MSHRHITAVLVSVLLCLCTALANATSMKKDTSANIDKQANSSLPEKNEQNPEQLASVLALDADIEFGAYLAGECLTCHTPTSSNEAIPNIHGKEKAYLVSAILEYKNKQRNNDVMRGITAALSNDEIAAIATYLSAQ